MKYGITLHTKQMIKVNELTRGGNTSNLAKHLSLAHPDFFRELTLEIDGLVTYVHHKFIIVSFIHNLFACFKVFPVKCFIGGSLVVRRALFLSPYI